jgi:hypothetical protein
MLMLSPHMHVLHVDLQQSATVCLDCCQSLCFASSAPRMAAGEAEQEDTTGLAGSSTAGQGAGDGEGAGLTPAVEAGSDLSPEEGEQLAPWGCLSHHNT